MCSTDLIVDCSRQLLSTVPNFSPENVLYKKLDLSHNELYSISPQSFDDLSVTSIDLRHNELIGISPRAFYSLRKDLEGLDLSSSRIMILHWAVFKDLEKLKTLRYDMSMSEMMQFLASYVLLDWIIIFGSWINNV